MRHNFQLLQKVCEEINSINSSCCIEIQTHAPKFLSATKQRQVFGVGKFQQALMRCYDNHNVFSHFYESFSKRFCFYMLLNCVSK